VVTDNHSFIIVYIDTVSPVREQFFRLAQTSIGILQYLLSNPLLSICLPFEQFLKSLYLQYLFAYFFWDSNKFSSDFRCYNRIQPTPSTAYTEYCIHWVLHTPSAASSQDWLSPAASQLSSLGGPYWTQLTTFPRLRVNQWIASRLPSHLPPDLPPPDRPPASTPPISIHHGIQVHLQTRLITASKCIFEFTQSCTPIASPNSLDQGLQVHLWVRSISASKCISELTRARRQSASLNSLDHGLQLHR